MRVAIKLDPFGTSAEHVCRGRAILLPLKLLSSNCIIRTLFYCLTIKRNHIAHISQPFLSNIEASKYDPQNGTIRFTLCMYIHTKPWSRVKWWLAIQAASSISAAASIHTYILGLQMLAQEYYAAETAQGEGGTFWVAMTSVISDASWISSKVERRRLLQPGHHQRDLGFVLSRSTGKQHQKLLPASI